jgi:hypothetical protein
MTDSATYLYAITRPLDSRQLVTLKGIGGAPVRALADGGLQCLVSTVPLAEFGEKPLQHNLGDLQWLERTARAHDAVVRAAAEQVTTAPLRLATVCTDDDAALARLRELRDRAAPLLDRLDGRIEWGVKVFAMSPADARPQPAVVGARSGTEYLRVRREQAAERERASAAAGSQAESVYRELAGAAVAGRRHRPQDPQLSGRSEPMLLNAAFLVDRNRSAEFAALAGRLADDRGSIRVEVTGPWPPYSFAVLDQT